ncbi:Calcineurin-like phosphoesterase [Flavobacterium fryxellicola]|uniref:Metallophosphoesterase n=1 Tax=Flavobacterium fryxellicola TaxID=249352 RepID=A0A167ZM67_9FLAO|nr:metallophosphoesterase [Flavobacterium fryxellicola]OAB30601.1 metallophosphoesterase [Flavobacterium fryxellicola]SHN77335.1 Calcineurin-like phosphoesterase [Flavobacterium fryxellicola]
MKIQYCSDLHLEFPENKKFVLQNPIKPEADILILAGDIVPFASIDKHQDFFDYISEHFKMTFWIPGNHEYYYYNIATKNGVLEEQIRENVFLVNNCVKEISGINLIFSTLWSNISPLTQWLIKESLSDFKVIKYKNRLFNPDDYNMLHQESLAFIKKAVQESNDKKTIVVTHHAPTFSHYPEKYANSKINEAFASNLDVFIENNTIDYWIYGHNHCNVNDFEIKNTKLLTNQLGYIKYNENVGFNDKAIISV